MKNKINIAELLKNCPSGMELDCVMYDNLYFDKVVEDFRYPIGCYTIYDGCRTSVNFTEFGEFNNYGTAKCVIFPKGKNTWEGFQRPFKDGDIVHGDNFCCSYISIYKSNRENNSFYCYAALNSYGKFKFNDYADKSNLRFATEEEKEKLFQAIKDNGYQWNAETKTLEKLVKPKFEIGDEIVDTLRKHVGAMGTQGVISEITDDKYIFTDGSYMSICSQDNWELVSNKFDINSLVPFESKVLVRDSNVEKWRPATWGYCDIDSEYNYPYEVVGGHGFSMCIPYEGNSHLMGKTDDCDEFYKTW